jgi:clan AA aspartic protease
MQGYVDDQFQPKIKIGTKGMRKAVEIEAVIDTGFSGDLCLPFAIATQLGLELWGDRLVELADGSVKRDILFLGMAVWDDKDKVVEISLTESEEALVGSGLLEEKRLTIDYADKVVMIEPKTIS